MLFRSQQNSIEQFSPEAEARKMLELMGKSGVMSRDYVEQILSGANRELTPVIDAEVISESDVELFGEPTSGEDNE